MKVSVLKYNAGNTKSVLFALERIGISALVTDDIETLTTSDKVIFPGVGEASSAMKYLNEHHLSESIVNLKQPVLGICLGMQLMCSHSEEGDTTCLGIFENKVKLLSGNIKVPQIGWNTIENLKTQLYKGVKEKEYVYYVHSYFAEINQYTIATTNYGSDYSASLQKNNFYSTQFHPEKSGDAGQTILENFIKL